MSYCTDESVWEYLDKEEDAHERAFCKDNAFGGMCKRAMAQVMEHARKFSTPELACQGLLYRDLKSFIDKEKEAFQKAFAIAQAHHDAELNTLLLKDPRFANNAKIIMLLRSFDPAAMNEDIADKLQLNISLRKEKQA